MAVRSRSSSLVAEFPNRLEGVNLLAATDNNNWLCCGRVLRRVSGSLEG